MKNNTPLKQEVKAVFDTLLGPEVAKQVDQFENPNNYPKDFLDECAYFLGNLIGMDAAHKKLEQFYIKYKIKTAKEVK